MIENYGAYAELGQSQALTPVSTETVLIGIGACSGGDLNKPYWITSLSDYASHLDGIEGDGYNLTELVISAFQVANISKIVLIPVSHSKAFTQADYLGDAELYTGVYALESFLRENPSTVNLIVMPSITDDEVLAALNGVCASADGHWQSFMVYDLPEEATQINASNVAIPAEIVAEKQLFSERARCVWGHIKTSSGHVVSGAAIQACLMAKSDAEKKCPYRTGGNLAVSNIISPVMEITTETTYLNYTQVEIPTTGIKIETSAGVYVDWNDNAVYSTTLVNCEPIEIDGKVGVKRLSGSGSATYPSVKETLVEAKNLVIPQPIGNQLSADGVCSWINYGGGNWHCWGDHTAAFANGQASDERSRFDNTIRMQMMIVNRFQLKYRFSIDDPMDLGMRNDIIDEELTYLNQLVAKQALIGEPSVEFRPIDNPVDDIQRGEFTFTIATTPTIPAKYLNAKVIYTQAGLSVYTTGEE